jgi:hypothetical protein
MAAPLAVCTKEEQGAVTDFSGRKVCQGLKFIGGFQHDTGTVLYRVEVCMTSANAYSTATTMKAKKNF